MNLLKSKFRLVIAANYSEAGIKNGLLQILWSAIDADSIFCTSCGERFKKMDDQRLTESKSFEQMGTITSEERLTFIKDLMCELTDQDLKELRTRIEILLGNLAILFTYENNHWTI